MPRKRTVSALYKSERTQEQKEADKAKSRRLANRRYQRKVNRNEPDKRAEKIAKERESMSETEKASAKEKRQVYNSVHYLRHREDILDKQMKKRTQSYIKKHGESAYWASYPHRKVERRKSQVTK